MSSIQVSPRKAGLQNCNQDKLHLIATIQYAKTFILAEDQYSYH